LVVALRGELDAVSATLLRDEMASTHEPGNVAVDARDLTFIDSSGIRAFVELGKRLAHSGHTLAVRNAQPQVYRVMEITGLLERLHVTGPIR
jgi:anti-anti-sigma factor